MRLHTVSEYITSPCAVQSHFFNILRIGIVVSFFLFPSQAAYAATASINITETSVAQGVAYNVSWTSSGAASCVISGPGLSSTLLNSTGVSVTQSTTGVKNYSITCYTSGCSWAFTRTEFDTGCGGPGSCFGMCTLPGAICEDGDNNRMGGNGEPLPCNTDIYTCTGTCSTVSGTDSVTITSAPTPTVTLSAPVSIAYGSSGTLTWSSTGASSCTGTGFSTANATNNSTGVAITPVQNTTYSITCTNAFGGTVSQSKTVLVTGVPAPTVNFSASPSTVTLGGFSTLTWSTTNAGSGCVGTGFSTGGLASGNVTATPAVTTSYSITCTGQGGTDTASAEVGVTSESASAITVYDGDAKPYQVALDANANGGVPISDTSSVYAGVLERNRMCFVIDPTAYPTSLPWWTRSFTSPGNNTVIKYNGSTWSINPASGNNSKYHWMTCQTTATPDVALSGNGVAGTASITVASGSAVNLTWLSQYGSVRKGTCSAQNFATDTWVPGHYEDQWTCEPGCGTGDQQCASAPHKPLASAFSHILKFVGLKPEIAYALPPGMCNNNPVWVPGATANKPFGGSTTVNPLVTTTYTYTCANAMGTVAKSITVNVPGTTECTDLVSNGDNDTSIDGADLGCTITPPPSCVGCIPTEHSDMPDLTIGLVTQTTATQLVASTLSATVSNSSGAATGVGFTNLFQIDDNADHAAVFTTMTDPSPALNANGTDVTAISYAFPTAGVWYVRACADNNASWVGSVRETDETTTSGSANNCGATWTAVTVASSVPTASLSANPLTVASNNASTLTYTCTNSTSASISPTIGSVNPVGTNQVSTGPLSVTTAFTLTCVGAGGSSPASANVTVNVPTFNFVPPVSKLVRKGSSVNIVWTSVGATSCSVSGPGLPPPVPPALTGSVPVVINNQSTFTISCNGLPAKKMTIGLIPEFNED